MTSPIAARPVIRITALALPLLALAALTASNTGNAVAAVIVLTAAVAAPIALHVLARLATRRLGSASLPRRVWVTVTTALWFGIAGALAMGQHALSMESGPGEMLFFRIAGAAWLGATVAIMLALVFAVAMTVRLIAGTRSTAPLLQLQ
ncbi:hypothetical protein ACFVU2_18190 [Leifsonia sp. NPDC058194]|uniref:hypothetical protein n=1 Tax=Leifsonia sp. NPDC058194 TaxID=3346374 RepID=UPI0036D7F65E